MRNTTSKGTRMTEEEYKNIKLMTDTALSIATITKISNRSSATVSFIRISKNYEDYKAIVDSHIQKGYAKKKAKEEALAQSKVAEVLQEDTPKVEEKPAKKIDYTVTSNTEQIVTSVNNLTQAVLTMTSVLNRIAENNIPQQSKSFLSRR